MTSIYEDNDTHSLELVEGIGQDNSQEELDFSYLFLYNPSDDFRRNEAGNSVVPPHDDHNPSSMVPYPCDEIPGSAPTTSSQSSYHHGPVPDSLSGPGFNSLDLPSRPVGAPSPSPRIEITPSGDPHQTHPLDASSRTMALTVPGYENTAYREPQSPASSNSSTGWLSEAYSPWVSPCVSPSGGGGAVGLTALDLLPGLQGIHTSSAHSSPGTSPRTSITEETFLVPQSQRSSSPHSQSQRSSSPHSHDYPRSRSASPQGKRTYDQYSGPNLGTTSQQQQRSRSPSPSPSPHHPQERYLAQADPQANAPQQVPSLEEVLSSLNSSLPRAVPSKMVRPSVECYTYGESQGEHGRRGRAGAETFYIPTSVWPAPLAHGAFSGIPVPSLPPLEWHLPSHSDQYELCLEQQPKQHHRAHYETEGSRGAVKAPVGGHTVVQLHGYRGKAPLGLLVFIGTADERILKPHAFYQVHRITGKTVTTPSQERKVNGTKVLEIPLEPKNNMKAVIDCAGILKLRNADIELRTGETDMGRKNTCVRLVFRVHIPHPGGQYVCLQVASLPIECSQRSAHQLPTVERQDVERCSVLGGQQMILTGQNLTSDSKVVFTEKTPDGLQIWEAEATVDRDKSQKSMLFVEIPPYRDPTIYHAAKVNFYVINGRRKRSQAQHFTYTPLTVPAIKTEPVDDFQFSQLDCAVSQILGMSPKTYQHTPSSHLNPNSQIVAGMTSLASCQRASHHDPTVTVSAYQPQDPSVYCPSKSRSLGSSPVLYQDMNHHPVMIHSGSPSQMSYTQHYSSLVSQPFHPSHSATNQRVVNVAVPVAQHQHATMVGDGYRAAASLWKAGASPEVCSSEGRYQGFMHTVVPVSGRSPPRHSHILTQRGPATTGSQSGPVRGKVTAKQENLNQAYLDDDSIRYMGDTY
ncbi:nuclear factor of activated T-cells, cytoplasmic 2 isoform X1 [Coregonus clupeaformis]|uniref:nuclear factor of activated T-cells, cytoplasmic 2 isoform X1 n=1 Tax=Coregonus clupeaformis TaxID=59861 RepID=UPI001BE129D9|nr:nuclear factor of activated T-cells, cytoplasmic 2 isoform X1 [Coregonus clupeaformis]